MADITYNQLLATIIPILVSGVVAIFTAVVSATLRAQISGLQTRVAILEQILVDNHIPIPPDKTPPTIRS